MAISTSNLQQLYIAYFDRPADPAGLAYWQGLLDGGQVTLSTVAETFGASAEFQVRQAGMNTSALINHVYINLFGHNADAGGLLYWTDLVNHGAATLRQVTAAIGTSAVGSDALALVAKTSYATAFTNFVAGTPERIAEYTGAAANIDAQVRLGAVQDQASLDAQLALLGKPWPIIVVTPVQGGAQMAAAVPPDEAHPVALVGVADAGHGALHG